MYFVGFRGPRELALSGLGILSAVLLNVVIRVYTLILGAE